MWITVLVSQLDNTSYTQAVYSYRTRVHAPSGPL